MLNKIIYYFFPSYDKAIKLVDSAVTARPYLLGLQSRKLVAHVLGERDTVAMPCAELIHAGFMLRYAEDELVKDLVSAAAAEAMLANSFPDSKFDGIGKFDRSDFRSDFLLAVNRRWVNYMQHQGFNIS